MSKEPYTFFETLFQFAATANCSLSRAATVLGVDREVLKEAVIYRMYVADEGREFDMNYARTIRTALKRIRSAN